MTAEPFSWPIRIYWEDTDGGGIVYYANYMKFLERARTEWLRSFGYSQQSLATDPGLLFAVVNVNINYLKPAKLDDLLIVTCAPEIESRVVARFVQRIHRNGLAGELLTEATVQVACIDARNHRLRRLPDFVRSAG